MMILLKLRENIIPIKLFQRKIKVRIILLIFLSGIIIPNFLFAQITQQGPKLVGIGAVGSPVYQGQSVAISSDGNTAIEGGYFDNNNVGAVWVFTRSSGVGIRKIKNWLAQVQPGYVTREFRLLFLQMAALLLWADPLIISIQVLLGYSPETMVFGHRSEERRV